MWCEEGDKSNSSTIKTKQKYDDEFKKKPELQRVR
jgi:hypothetical protein